MNPSSSSTSLRHVHSGGCFDALDDAMAMAAAMELGTKKIED
jgi:hypothetical protein